MSAQAVVPKENETKTRRWRNIVNCTNPLINAGTLFSSAAISETFNFINSYLGYKLKPKKGQAKETIQVIVRELYFCKWQVDLDFERARMLFEKIGAKCEPDHYNSADHDVKILRIDFQGFQTCLSCGFRGMTRFSHGAGQEIDRDAYKSAVLKGRQIPVKFVWNTTIKSFCEFVSAVQESLVDMCAPGQTRVVMSIIHQYFEIDMVCIYHEMMHEYQLDIWRNGKRRRELERAIIYPKFIIRFPSTRSCH